MLKWVHENRPRVLWAAIEKCQGVKYSSPNEKLASAPEAVCSSLEDPVLPLLPREYEPRTRISQ